MQCSVIIVRPPIGDVAWPGLTLGSFYKAKMILKPYKSTKTKS